MTNNIQNNKVHNYSIKLGSPSNPSDINLKLHRLSEHPADVGGSNVDKAQYVVQVIDTSGKVIDERGITEEVFRAWDQVHGDIPGSRTKEKGNVNPELLLRHFTIFKEIGLSSYCIDSFKQVAQDKDEAPSDRFKALTGILAYGDDNTIADLKKTALDLAEDALQEGRISNDDFDKICNALSGKATFSPNLFIHLGNDDDQFYLAREIRSFEGANAIFVDNIAKALETHGIKVLSARKSTTSPLPHNRPSSGNGTKPSIGDSMRHGLLKAAHALDPLIPSALSTRIAQSMLKKPEDELAANPKSRQRARDLLENRAKTILQNTSLQGDKFHKEVEEIIKTPDGAHAFAKGLAEVSQYREFKGILTKHNLSQDQLESIFDEITTYLPSLDEQSSEEAIQDLRNKVEPIITPILNDQLNREERTAAISSIGINLGALGVLKDTIMKDLINGEATNRRFGRAESYAEIIKQYPNKDYLMDELCNALIDPRMTASLAKDLIYGLKLASDPDKELIHDDSATQLMANLRQKLGDIDKQNRAPILRRLAAYGIRFGASKRFELPSVPQNKLIDEDAYADEGELDDLQDRLMRLKLPSVPNNNLIDEEEIDELGQRPSSLSINEHEQQYVFLPISNNDSPSVSDEPDDLANLRQTLEWDAEDAKLLDQFHAFEDSLVTPPSVSIVNTVTEKPEIINEQTAQNPDNFSNPSSSSHEEPDNTSDIALKIEITDEEIKISPMTVVISEPAPEPADIYKPLRDPELQKPISLPKSTSVKIDIEDELSDWKETFEDIDGGGYPRNIETWERIPLSRSLEDMRNALENVQNKAINPDALQSALDATEIFEAVIKPTAPSKTNYADLLKAARNFSDAVQNLTTTLGEGIQEIARPIQEIKATVPASVRDDALAGLDEIISSLVAPDYAGMTPQQAAAEIAKLKQRIHASEASEDQKLDAYEQLFRLTYARGGKELKDHPFVQSDLAMLRNLLRKMIEQNGNFSSKFNQEKDLEKKRELETLSKEYGSYATSLSRFISDMERKISRTR